MGIKHREAVHCEADDLIAGYALTYGQHTEVVISSFDSDFFQLLTDRVRETDHCNRKQDQKDNRIREKGQKWCIRY